MTAPIHVSQNRLSGSLADAPVPRILDACRKNLVTGWVQISSGENTGSIELRGGGVDSATFADEVGSAALKKLCALVEGDYEIVQRLPRLDGELGTAAAFEGDLSDVSLVQLMRHCEDNALTCTITIVHEFDRGQIVYQAGDIVAVELNGVENEDKIIEMVRLQNARFRVSAPPLDVDIEGWPSVRRDVTEPFVVDKHARSVGCRANTGRAAGLPGVAPQAPPNTKRPPGVPRRRVASGTGRHTPVGGAEHLDGMITRFRLGLARAIAGHPIDLKPSMVVPAAAPGRRFERAAFAILRWFGRSPELGQDERLAE